MKAKVLSFGGEGGVRDGKSMATERRVLRANCMNEPADRQAAPCVAESKIRTPKSDCLRRSGCSDSSTFHIDECAPPGGDPDHTCSQHLCYLVRGMRRVRKRACKDVSTFNALTSNCVEVPGT